MRRSVALLTILGILVVGVAVGVVGTHLFYAKLFRRHGGPSAFMGHHFVERLEHELDLTDDQRDEIEEILARAHDQGEALRHEVRPKMQALFDAIASEIDTILTPEQREEFQRLRESQRGRMERFLGPRRRPGAHGPPPAGEPPPD